MKYEHLLNLDFDYKRQNCYHLVRAVYRDNYGIELPNLAAPKHFWDYGLDLYSETYRKIGFEPIDVHPSQYRLGDVFMMAIKSTVPNHLGTLVGTNKILHHLWGNLSTAEPYRDLLRNTTVAVMRHKDVVHSEQEQTADLLDYLSPSVRRKLDEYR